MHASGSVVGKCYLCCFCSSFLSSISLHIQKSEKCSMPSCLRANVNQQDKPSEDVMGLTTDDPSALCYHPVACISCWTTGSRRKRVEIQQRTHSSSSFWCWEGNDAHSGHLLLLSSSYLGSREIRENNPGTWESKKWVNVKNIVHFKFSVHHQENARTGFGVLLLKRRCRQVLSWNAPADPQVFLCSVSLTCKKKCQH